MTTLEYGAATDPNTALLAALHDPTSSITEAKFITSAQLPPHEKPTHRPPARIIVTYGYISDDAVAHDDHRSIDIMWSEAVWGPIAVMSKRQAQHANLSPIQNHRFFIDLCTQLAPLYANYGAEAMGLTPCLYDVIYQQPQSHWRNAGPCYLRDGVLTDEEHASFLSTFTFVEKLPCGTFFTNDPWLAGQKKLPKGPTQPSGTPMANVLTPALRRWRRAHL
ncbi:MAG: hypothetical protein H0X24_15020 [Ktedonobacterales bacterium]|nr:hypothetical protein [Ktedonobacterales bacterium]